MWWAARARQERAGEPRRAHLGAERVEHGAPCPAEAPGRDLGPEHLRARENRAERRHLAPLCGPPARTPDRAASQRRLPQPVPGVGIGSATEPGSCRRGRAGQGGGRDGESARERRGHTARDCGAARARTGGPGTAGSPPTAVQLPAPRPHGAFTTSDDAPSESRRRSHDCKGSLGVPWRPSNCLFRTTRPRAVPERL